MRVSEEERSVLSRGIRRVNTRYINSTRGTSSDCFPLNGIKKCKFFLIPFKGKRGCHT